MKITVLGSGTSSGVPVIGCSCEVCLSKNPKNNRLRSSIYIELSPEEVAGKEDQRHILIDTGPDFRTQALRFKIPKIDLILFTHTHADHIYGLDDVRMYNFIQKSSIPIYGEEAVVSNLKRAFSYCFELDPDYEGGGVPKLSSNIISAGSEIFLGKFKIIALRAYHGSLPILGFRIGTFAYLTDCSRIPDETVESLKGVTHLILDGLRFRPHRTHFTIPQAAATARQLNIKETWLTHISHDVEHERTSQELLDQHGGKVNLAYDGLTVQL